MKTLNFTWMNAVERHDLEVETYIELELARNLLDTNGQRYSARELKLISVGNDSEQGYSLVKIKGDGDDFKMAFRGHSKTERIAFMEGQEFDVHPDAGTITAFPKTITAVLKPDGNAVYVKKTALFGLVAAYRKMDADAFHRIYKPDAPERGNPFLRGPENSG